MTEATIKALMSAVDEVAWEQEGLFNVFDKPLTSQLPTLEPSSELSKQTVESFPSSSAGRVVGVRPNIERSGLTMTGCAVTIGASNLWGGGETFPAGRKHFPKRQLNKKSWLPNRAWWKMVLGDDFGLEEAVSLALITLVGIFSYHSLCFTPMLSWMEANWSPMLGYTPEFFFLLRGWFGTLYLLRAFYSFSIFLCMSPTRLGYKELGLDLVEPLQD
jgi:hypothetical protein